MVSRASPCGKENLVFVQPSLLLPLRTQNNGVAGRIVLSDISPRVARKQTVNVELDRWDCGTFASQARYSVQRNYYSVVLQHHFGAVQLIDLLCRGSDDEFTFCPHCNVIEDRGGTCPKIAFLRCW